MLMTKIKAMAAVGLLVGFSVGGAGVLAHEFGQSGAQAPQSSQEESDRLNKQLVDVRKDASELRRRQEELIGELESLRRELKKSQAAQTKQSAGGMTMPGGGGMGMGMYGGGGGMGMPGVGGMGMGGMYGGGGGMGMSAMGGMGLGGGGGGMGMPGFGFSKPSIPTIESAGIIVVQSPARDKVWAQSNENGVWKMYRVPKGVKAVPVLTNQIAALFIEGPEVNQVTAFEAESGEWITQELREPAKGKITPIVSTVLAAYPIGRYVYAFSAQAKKWGVLELAEGAKPSPIVSQTYIKVEDGGRLHLFNAKTGRWSELDTKSDE